MGPIFARPGLYDHDQPWLRNCVQCHHWDAAAEAHASLHIGLSNSPAPLLKSLGRHAPGGRHAGTGNVTWRRRVGGGHPGRYAKRFCRARQTQLHTALLRVHCIDFIIKSCRYTAAGCTRSTSFGRSGRFTARAAGDATAGAPLWRAIGARRGSRDGDPWKVAAKGTEVRGGRDCPSLSTGSAHCALLLVLSFSTILPLTLPSSLYRLPSTRSLATHDHLSSPETSPLLGSARLQLHQRTSDAASELDHITLSGTASAPKGRPFPHSLS